MIMNNNNYNIRFFDVIEYVKKLRNLGVKQEVAEVQAQEIEYAIETAVERSRKEFKNKELATKHDLEIVKFELQKEIEIVRQEIKELEVKIKNVEIRLMLLMAGGYATMLGVMAKGFHWI